MNEPFSVDPLSPSVVNIGTVEGDVYIIPNAPRVMQSGEVAPVEFDSQGNPIIVHERIRPLPVRGGAGGLVNKNEKIQASLDALVDSINLRGEYTDYALSNAITSTYLEGVAMGAIAWINAYRQKQFDESVGQLLDETSRLVPVRIAPPPSAPRVRATFVFLSDTMTPQQSAVKFAQLYGQRLSGFVQPIPPPANLSPGWIPTENITVETDSSNAPTLSNLAEEASKNASFGAEVYVKILPIQS